MPITPTSIRQGKGAGNTGNNNSVMGQYFATQNQQSTAPTNTGLTDEQKMQDYAMVNNKNTITNSATSGVSPAVNKPDFSVNTFPGPSSQQPQGKGAASTNSATSGQPRMGQPNNYANTVGGWDNASIRPQGSAGKGKGG
jgi:hypothetical protein